jgi:hypothetical protein
VLQNEVSAMKLLLLLSLLLLIPVYAEAHWDRSFLHVGIIPSSGFIAPLPTPIYQSPYGQAFGGVAIQQMMRPRCYLQPVYEETLYGIQEVYERVCF